MKKSIFFFVAILYCIVFTLCKPKLRTLPYYNTADFTPVWVLPQNNNFHQIRPFHLLDQKGKVFTEKDLENKICVVDFFFTTCPGICPKMTNNMAVLQKEFSNNSNILLLSHSVMPQADSVSVLANYALEKGVRYDKWKLLTGTMEEIYDLGRKYYFVEEDEGENRDISIFLHTENFVLIDKNRRIRGIYNGLDDTSIQSVIADAQALETEE